MAVDEVVGRSPDRRSPGLPRTTARYAANLAGPRGDGAARAAHADDDDVVHVQFLLKQSPYQLSRPAAPTTARPARIPAGAALGSGSLPCVDINIGQQRSVGAGQPEPKQMATVLWFWEILVGGARMHDPVVADELHVARTEAMSRWIAGSSASASRASQAASSCGVSRGTSGKRCTPFSWRCARRSRPFRHRAWG